MSDEFAVVVVRGGIAIKADINSDVELGHIGFKILKIVGRARRFEAVDQILSMLKIVQMNANETC